ncbi:MAG: cyclomaltodextrinase N-terminal domain-containing protein, partial [Terracidiphilus sp.]
MKALHLALVLLAATAIAPLRAEKPAITSIDPPDWFVQLPDPMLLVHGTGLAGAKFAVAPAAVAIEKTQISPNGHWAFLWLKTATAAPQTLRITATTAAGSAAANWQLKP